MGKRLKTQVMKKVLIYDLNHIHLGVGYLFIAHDGSIGSTLYDHEGNELPEGPYKVILTNEEHLITLNKSIH